MKTLSSLFVLTLILVLSGCSGKSMPDFALTQPEQGITTSHPDALEEVGGTIVTFTGILHERLITETLEISIEGIRGVWPFAGVSLTDMEAPIVSGFCYSALNYAFGDKNPWAEIPAQCVILGNKEEFIAKNYAFALANKDGGVWLSSPIGTVPGYDITIVDDRTYDFHRFENDAEYRIQIMKKIGKTLPVISEEWNRRIKGFGVELAVEDVQEITITDGNPAWEHFRKKMIYNMGFELKMPNGEVVASYYSEEDMEKILSRNPRITPWQRFFSRLRLPIATPEVMAFGAASSVIDGTIAAFIDDGWNTAVARGTCQRRDLSEQVAFLFNLYKREHVKRMVGR